MSGARLLVLDIETAPNLGYHWGLWQQNIEAMHQLVTPARMLCYGAKWHGGRKKFFASEYHDGRIEMLTTLRDLMDEADAVVGWNSARFDRRWVVGEMDKDGLWLPAPSKDIDLMKVARKNLYLPSYKLDYVAQRHYGLPGKVVHQGFKLWADILSGDPELVEKAWRMMKRYQLGDIDVTDAVLGRMKPMIYSLPNNALFNDAGDPARCECGSERFQRRGFNYTRTRKYQRWQCQGCGSWYQSRKSVPLVTPELVRVVR